MWQNWNGNNMNFRYENMKYQKSCVPCSLEIILRNLGYIGDVTEIQDLWNDMHTEKVEGGLNSRGVEENELHEYLAKTSAYAQRGTIYSPISFDQNGINIIANRINNDFINTAGPSGMLVGIEHAQVIFKDAAGHVVYINPAPDLGQICIVPVNNLNAAAVQGTDGSFAVQFNDGNNLITYGTYAIILR